MYSFCKSKPLACKSIVTKMYWGVATALALVPAAASAQVAIQGTVTIIKPIATGPALDYSNAKPLPLPKAAAAPGFASNLTTSHPSGPVGGAPGGEGTGVQHPVFVPQSTISVSNEPKPVPQEYGTSGQPYTTSKVNSYGNQPTNYYPFRATGKLYFQETNGTYVCSGSFIKPGVVLTAAHCVANYGKSQAYSGWTFYPGLNDTTAPYGAVTAKYVILPTAYYNGTDNCYQYGVVCPDDVALLVTNQLTGNTTGWYGYYYGGAGFNSSNQVLISQLGYPQALDSGTHLERTDSQGYVNSTYSSNTIIGSLQTGGSSGGPWLVNLGKDPTLSSGTAFGSYADHNVAVGVTSWGYGDQSSVKQLGASPFTANNIGALVTKACQVAPGNC